MALTRGKKRKTEDIDVDLLPDESISTTGPVKTQPETSLTRRDGLWFNDGSVVLVARGNVGFKVSIDTSS